MIKNGIDVSRWQGVIDWCKVKASGAVDFAILKIGGSDGGLYKDSKFEANYYGCKGHNIPVGAYFFIGSDCNSAERGKNLAVSILSMLKGYAFEYPIYIDVEGTNISEKNGVTEAVATICEILEKSGAYVGIYGSDISTFKDRLDCSKLTQYDKWVARYPLTSNCTVVTSCGMRQYSSTGKIDGINGNVDLDVSYYDFPTIMKSKHLNEF